MHGHLATPSRENSHTVTEQSHSQQELRSSHYTIRKVMLPLPSEPYEPANWFPDLKVGNDYLASDGMNKYSVPCDLIGEKVNLWLTPNTVEVFFWGSRVAIHICSKVFCRDPVVKLEHAQSRRSLCTIPPEMVHNGSGIVAALVVHPRSSD